jgi:hypothetical protein
MIAERSAPVKNYLTFEADFPDDAQWSSSGDLLVPPGRGVAEAVGAGLKARDIPMGEVSQHESFGWAFSAEPYWCLLQYPGHWLAIVEDYSSLVHKVLRRATTAADFETFLKTFHDVLASDPRISNIHGYTRTEYESLK